jgi:ubiquinone/menaquinone biosynthesis C-methylase UbiE
VTEADFLRETRDSYDALAVDYAAYFREELASKPLERAVLGAFAELVKAEGGGPVADVGCGTGRVSAHLHGLGVDVFGVDLSPGMVEVARAAHPQLRFQVGSMLSLDLPDASVGGLMAWYSVVHIPDERLPEAFAEFRRVLAPGGHLLLAFQVGDEPMRRTEALGHTIALEFHRRRPERVAELLEQAGLTVRSRLERAPQSDGPFPEHLPQALLLCQKPRRG